MAYTPPWIRNKAQAAVIEEDMPPYETPYMLPTDFDIPPYETPKRSWESNVTPRDWETIPVVGDYLKWRREQETTYQRPEEQTRIAQEVEKFETDPIERLKGLVGFSEGARYLKTPEGYQPISASMGLGEFMGGGATAGLKGMAAFKEMLKGGTKLGADALQNVQNLFKYGAKAEEVFKVLTETSDFGRKFPVSEAQNLIRTASLAAKQVDPVISKLGGLIKQAESLTGEKAALIHAERKARLGKMGEVTGEGLEKYYKKLSTLKGEMPKPEFTPLVEQFTDIEKGHLHDLIDTHNFKGLPDNFQGYTRIATEEGLESLLAGKVPEAKQLQYLKEVFGDDIIGDITKHIKRGTWDTVLDLLGIPRAIQSSSDISFLLRQGGILQAYTPTSFPKNFASSIQTFFSGKRAQLLDEVVKSNKWFGVATSASRNAEKRLFLPEWTDIAAKLSKKEEAFQTNLIHKIPVIKQTIGKLVEASERSFLSVGNKIKMDAFAKISNTMEKAGVELTDDIAGTLAQFINIASGRGDLGKLNAIAPVLNQLFYSSRYLASRLELPVVMGKLAKDAFKGIPRNLTPEQMVTAENAMKANRILFREANRALVQWFAMGLTFLGIGAAAGGTVELDPRSTDFGKLKLGNTRLDIWAGFQQFARAMTQMVTGSKKFTTTGGIAPIDREKLFISFLRSKFSPQLGFLWDLMAGETMVGEEMRPTIEGIGEQAKNRLLSMSIQDTWDALEDEGLIGGLKALPSFVGIGVQTYPDSLNEMEIKIGSPYTRKVKGEEVTEIYQLSDFAGDIGKRGYTQGMSGSPLVQFHFQSKKVLEPYNKLSTDKRVEYREKNPNVDATLFFWGKVTTLKSDKAKELVKSWLTQYELPESALNTPLSKSATTYTPSWLKPPTYKEKYK